jgi:5-methylcytosine-specific restriction endonuclease McrA
MARDSADSGTSPCPTSAHDAVQQLSSNLSRLSHVGTSLWESTRSRLRHQKSPYQKQRPNVLKRKDNRGLPLLGVRRALTLPLPEKGSREATWDFTQNTVDQSNSGLCTRLPYEVRSLIFKLVVAGESNVVHVFKRSKKMGHWRCRRQLDGLPCTWIDPCSKALPFKAMIMDENGVLISGDPSMQRYFDRSKIVPSKKDKDIGVLSLLCTCRQT